MIIRTRKPVVTGKLWETDRFVRSLDQLRSDDRVREIIFSTWEDEAATHQVMLNKFSQQYAGTALRGARRHPLCPRLRGRPQPCG